MVPKKSELEKKNKIKIIIFTIVSISKRNKTQLNEVQWLYFVLFSSLPKSYSKSGFLFLSFTSLQKKMKHNRSL